MLSASSVMSLRALRPAVLRAGVAMAVGARSKHTLPPLPYDFSALEPGVCLPPVLS